MNERYGVNGVFKYSISSKDSSELGVVHTLRFLGFFFRGGPVGSTVADDALAAAMGGRGMTVLLLVSVVVDDGAGGVGNWGAAGGKAAASGAAVGAPCSFSPFCIVNDSHYFSD